MDNHGSYCDNGSNFLGARKQIRRQNLKLDHDFIKNNLLRPWLYQEQFAEPVSWMAPQSPFCSSLWRRVDSKTSSSFEFGFCQIVKQALLLNLGSAKLTWDVFTSIVAEAECWVNARPLTNVKSDNEDEDALTPNHFLIGRAFPNIQACVFNENPSLKTKSWTQIRQRLEAIRMRLVREYLPTLNTRRKWTNPESKLEVNDVVWVLEEDSERNLALRTRDKDVHRPRTYCSIFWKPL